MFRSVSEACVLLCLRKPGGTAAAFEVAAIRRSLLSGSTRWPAPCQFELERQITFRVNDDLWADYLARLENSGRKGWNPGSLFVPRSRPNAAPAGWE